MMVFSFQRNFIQMEGGDMSIHDIASLEAIVNSLKTDTFLVLSRLSHGQSNDEIVKWSGSWNFSLLKIERALLEIYESFGLTALSSDAEKRKRAGDLYRACKEARYANKAPPPSTRRTLIEEIDQLFSDDKEEEDEMEPLNDPRVKNVGLLSAAHRSVAECLSRGLDNYHISKDLRMDVDAVERSVLEVCQFLQTDTLGSPIERRNLAGQLYLQSIAAAKEAETKPVTLVEMVRPLELKAEPQAPTASPAPPASTDKPFGVDVDRLAKRLADLSPRQKELVSCIVAGMDNEQCARKLGVAGTSPQAMLSALFMKLGLGRQIPTAARRLYVRAAGFHIIGNKEKATDAVRDAEALLEQVRATEVEVQLHAPSTSAPTHSEARTIALSAVDIGQVAFKLSKLSRRVKEVADCIARGLDNNAIAQEMGLSINSVVPYISNLYGQLGLGKALGLIERRSIVAEAQQLLMSGNLSAPAEDRAKTAEEVLEPTRPLAARAVNGNGTSPSPPTSHPPAASGNGHTLMPHYGPGVPIVLADPATILDVEVVSGEHMSGVFASHILRGKREGFRPETLVVYPTSDPTVTLGHLIFVKRERAAQ